MSFLAPDGAWQLFLAKFGSEQFGCNEQHRQEYLAKRMDCVYVVATSHEHAIQLLKQCRPQYTNLCSLEQLTDWNTNNTENQWQLVLPSIVANAVKVKNIQLEQLQKVGITVNELRRDLDLPTIAPPKSQEEAQASPTPTSGDAAIIEQANKREVPPTGEKPFPVVEEAVPAKRSWDYPWMTNELRAFRGQWRYPNEVESWDGFLDALNAYIEKDGFAYVWRVLNELGYAYEIHHLSAAGTICRHIDGPGHPDACYETTYGVQRIVIPAYTVTKIAKA